MGTLEARGRAARSTRGRATRSIVLILEERERKVAMLSDWLRVLGVEFWLQTWTKKKK